MQGTVAGLVLVSAILHLGWNMSMRGNPGSVRFAWWLTLTGGLAALAATLILHIPFNFHQVWPWLLGTITAHVFYFLGLVRLYHDGNLADIYPATRGGGVLGTALLATVFLHQVLPATTLIGVIGVGVLIALPALKAQWHVKTLLWTLVVALTIAVYSTIDSHGVHLLSPLPYIACQFFGTAVILTPWAWRDRTPGKIPAAAGAGLMSMLSYVLILYAYQRTATAPVLALRQISIALAPWAGWVFLRERIRRDALWVSLGIAVGSVLILRG